MNDREDTNRVVDIETLLARERDAAPRILVVDDETHILRAISRLLSIEDYNVVTASNGQDAVEMIDAENIAVLISDQRMPGMSGTEVLAYTRTNCPETVRIMITGNNDMETAVEAINTGRVFRFIPKPWDNQELLSIVAAAVEQYRVREAKKIYENHIEEQNELLKGLNEQLEVKVEQRTREVVAQSEEIRRLYHELEENFDATIKALLSIMELGNISIVQHCQRTAQRAKQLADVIALDEETTKHLERAALLHWIGLINAPKEIFTRQIDDFDASERATWEFHPLLGQQAIAHVPPLATAGEMILNYLKRYDDESFQPGVTNEDLDGAPSAALVTACRVLHICSTFERVRTLRRRSGDGENWVAFEEGVARLEAGRGGEFDPELVDQFVGRVSQEFLRDDRQEEERDLDALTPGMVLSRPLETQQGIPVAPRDMVVTEDLIDRLKRFAKSNGLKEIFVWA